MYILGGPCVSEDPTTTTTQGEGGGRRRPWEFLGPVRGMDQRQWAIDGTVMELGDKGKGELYFVYSGWPLENMDGDDSDLVQQLFILRLRDPVTAEAAEEEGGKGSVLLCSPDEKWERTGEHGINEGPQYLASCSSSSECDGDDDDEWKGIVYSCAGSWTNEYKMNTLQYLGGDPLDPSSWLKGTKPLIRNGDHGKGPWGPGHGSFLHVGSNDDDGGLGVLGVYHATDGPGDGWNNRKARMQRVVFTSNGPSMGDEVGKLTRDYEVFLGGAGDDGGDDQKKYALDTLVHKVKDEL